MQFWELIPNITSPLAALCFILYLLYMYKSREDEKIEKTLTIPNKDVQKNAADKILREYSDIEIAQIKSPEHAVELAKQIITNKLHRYHKTTNTLLSFTGIFAVTFLLSQLINKFDNDNIEVQSKDSNSWALLKATKAKLPYSIRTIVQHIKINEDTTSGVKTRIAEFRNFYTLTATRDISQDEKVFPEWFLSSFIDVKPMAGSEVQEIQSVQNGVYWLKFDLKKGDTKTIMTGANYIYKFPLTKRQNSNDCFNLEYNENEEWMTCYPNDTDYIDKLTIVIESDNIDISLSPISMYRKDKQGRIYEAEGSTRIYPPKDNENKKTLVATWNKIEQSECVGLRIKW